jgi:hypothetical protein
MKKFDVKEKIGAFLLKEDGKISKKSILKAGIILGTIALSARVIHGVGDHTHSNGGSFSKYNGDCPNVDAAKKTLPNPNDCTYDWQFTDSHTNAEHENNVYVKNLLGNLALGHDNCTETHANHANSYCHHEDDGGGGGTCGSACW